MDQISKFDTNYSDTKIKELTNEFDSITIDEDVIKGVTTTQNNVVEATKLSFRTKLFFGLSIAITALLMFLAIYNIFSINSVSGSIQILENNIATESTILNSLTNDVEAMKGSTSIEKELSDMGYIKMDDSDMIYVDIPEGTVVNDLTGSTNWFDSICNFISHVFGG